MERREREVLIVNEMKAESMTQPNTQDANILNFTGPRSRKETALEALPSKLIKRWTASAKKAVLEAIRVEAITVIDACRTYNLSAGELDSWDQREQAYGRNGLMATQVSRYRRASHHKASNTSLASAIDAETH